MWGRAEKSVCRGFSACRARASEEAARSASLIQMQRARPRRPVPLLLSATDSTPWSRPIAPDAFPFVILGRARQRRVEGRGSSTKLVEDTPSALPPGSTNEIGQCQTKSSRQRRPPSTTKGQQLVSGFDGRLRGDDEGCFARRLHLKEKPRQTAPHARRSSENSFSTITGTRADDQDAHRDRHLWPD